MLCMPTYIPLADCLKTYSCEIVYKFEIHLVMSGELVTAASGFVTAMLVVKLNWRWSLSCRGGR